jgi:hypothetical protein
LLESSQSSSARPSDKSDTKVKAFEASGVMVCDKGREILILYFMENCVIWGDLHTNEFNFDEFKSGGLQERHEVATGNIETTSAFEDKGKPRKPVSKWSIAGPSLRSTHTIPCSQQSGQHKKH